MVVVLDGKGGIDFTSDGGCQRKRLIIILLHVIPIGE